MQMHAGDLPGAAHLAERLAETDELALTQIGIKVFKMCVSCEQAVAMIEQHLIAPAVAQRSLDVLDAFGVDIWLFSNARWYTRNPHGEYVPHEKLAIKADPTIIADFTPHLTEACKIVGASSDFARLKDCEAAMKEAVGRDATAVRSQNYYLDVTPPGHDKGTFVAAISKRLGIPTDAVATIGDMENDLPMFARSGVSFAMGNASEAIKLQATHVTDSNERDGFAAAMEIVLGLT